MTLQLCRRDVENAFRNKGSSRKKKIIPSKLEQLFNTLVVWGKNRKNNGAPTLRRHFCWREGWMLVADHRSSSINLLRGRDATSFKSSQLADETAYYKIEHERDGTNTITLGYFGQGNGPDRRSLSHTICKVSFKKSNEKLILATFDLTGHPQCSYALGLPSPRNEKDALSSLSAIGDAMRAIEMRHVPFQALRKSLLKINNIQTHAPKSMPT